MVELSGEQFKERRDPTTGLSMTARPAHKSALDDDDEYEKAHPFGRELKPEEKGPDPYAKADQDKEHVAAMRVQYRKQIREQNTPAPRPAAQPRQPKPVDPGVKAMRDLRKVRSLATKARGRKGRKW